MQAVAVGLLAAGAFCFLALFLIGMARSLFDPIVMMGPLPDGPVRIPEPVRAELALRLLTGILTPMFCGAAVAWRLRDQAWLGAAATAGVLLALIYYLGSQLLGARLGIPVRVLPWAMFAGSLMFSLMSGLLAIGGGALARRLASNDERGRSTDGVLRGKAAIAEYWTIGLTAQPPLRFELIEVFRGAGMVCVLYRNVSRNRRVIEWFRFDDAGSVSHAAGIYAEPG